jgi:hypothetical protein
MKPLSYLLHGFVFAFGSAIILYGAVVNLNVLIHPVDVIPPILFSVLVFFLFVLFAYLLTRSLDAAGLIASLLVLGLFHLWTVFITVIGSTVFALVLFKIFFKRVGPADTHRVLNAISLAIVGYYLFQFYNLSIVGLWAPVPVTIQPVEGVPAPSTNQADTPDIYYIILDGYGRADMLQDVHGFDNSMFVDALKERGFVVTSDSQSNYARTLLSLSSSLNMQYLDTSSSTGEDSDLWWPLKDALQHGIVRKTLEDQGYKTYFVANNTDYSDIRDGDFYEAPFPIQLDIFSALYLYRTNLGLLAEIDGLGISSFSYDTHRRIIQYAFERLPEVAGMDGPKYVFAHIVAPHPPYVFDRAGNPVTPDYPFTLSVESHAGYIEQLQYVNQATLAMIDGILANSKSPPIIIIQGDHGPGTLTNHDSLKDTCLYERYSILNAYYLPGIDSSSIPMDISPVNSFRFIFNAYFNGHLDTLPSRRYFSTNDRFYEFVDVTSQTRDMCNESFNGAP